MISLAYINYLYWQILEIDQYFGDETLVMKTNQNKLLQMLTVLSMYFQFSLGNIFCDDPKVVIFIAKTIKQNNGSIS